MMVPLAISADGKRLLVWVFLGWSTAKLVAHLESLPGEMTLIDRDGAKRSTERHLVTFLPNSYHAAYPVMAEVWIDPKHLMIRSDFRAFIDRFQCDSEIIAALSSGNVLA
jgi:hypothetical protein